MLAPLVIQGGMGVAVSSWQLARAVSRTGQLGVVSGTALDTVLARRLQLGDPDGHMRRALAQFPDQAMAQRVLERYFIAAGKADDAPFRATPMAAAPLAREHQELLVLANFVEMRLAKEGHAAAVGVNLLEKIQAPTLAALYGAMLAGVDVVLMGAGIPRTIPGALDRLAAGEPAELALDVTGKSPEEEFVVRFDPAEFFGGPAPLLRRPEFLAIVSSATLASMLMKKSTGRVDGFVVEGPTAGGHNAPPRGALQLNSRGEPIYGERDAADLAAFRALGAPFWLAGSWGTPAGLVRALDEGAAGVQVGTLFAFSCESGLSDALKRQTLELVRRGQADVVTDPLASPTGFPFKVLQLPGSLTDSHLAAARRVTCDLGYLRRAYRLEDGTLGWRCPAEDVDAFVRKGGAAEEADGRRCICNALLANIGLGQRRPDGREELPLVTCGDAIGDIAALIRGEATEYSAGDVVEHLLSEVLAAASERQAQSMQQPRPATAERGVAHSMP